MSRPRRLVVALATLALVVAAGLLAVACGGGGGGGGDSAEPTTGKEIYRARCATCHGVDGQGGVGPELAGVVADRYPDIEDQIAVVTNGTGRMPSFRGVLDAAQIRTVVEYERTRLGQ